MVDFLCCVNSPVQRVTQLYTHFQLFFNILFHYALSQGLEYSSLYVRTLFILDYLFSVIFKNTLEWIFFPPSFFLRV